MIAGLDCATVPFGELGREAEGIIKVGLHACHAAGGRGNWGGGGTKWTVDVLFITACTAVWKITS